MIFISIDMLIGVRENSRRFPPSRVAEGPIPAVFAQRSPHRPVFYTARRRDGSDFRLWPACGGQDESAGFPGYNARDILESFTGEKLLPS